MADIELRYTRLNRGDIVWFLADGEKILRARLTAYDTLDELKERWSRSGVPAVEVAKTELPADIEVVR